MYTVKDPRGRIKDEKNSEVSGQLPFVNCQSSFVIGLWISDL